MSRDGRDRAAPWPPDFEAAWTQEGLVILRRGGAIFARVGETGRLGGQRLQAQYVPEHSRPDATRLCDASRFWVASPEKPA
ncbi:MAG: hypothetical protein KatS3mg014_2596 [Actinomycetota bacterium]|nr:MAG: hypothetical protein KatS3mg014_2596 [Actinomycetota bacterium]